jgi:YD repeat-containing protein
MQSMTDKVQQAMPRWRRVTDMFGHTTRFDYDLDGHLTGKSQPNYTRTDLGYNASGQLLTLTHRSFGTPFLQLNYGRDGKGLLTLATEVGDGTNSYTYDGPVTLPAPQAPPTPTAATGCASARRKVRTLRPSSGMCPAGCLYCWLMAPHSTSTDPTGLSWCLCWPPWSGVNKSTTSANVRGYPDAGINGSCFMRWLGLCTYWFSATALHDAGQTAVSGVRLSVSKSEYLRRRASARTDEVGEEARQDPMLVQQPAVLGL